MPTTATWMYQGRVITSIKDMPKGTYGFIYEVRYKPTDIRYIGKKVTKPIPFSYKNFNI